MNIYNSYLQLTKSIIKNRNLIIEMAKQELRDKYVGQVFGKYWVFIHPIFLTGMYLFVFGVVYRQRIGGTYVKAFPISRSEFKCKIQLSRR